MEEHTRGEAESLDNFELDEDVINELASIGYNSIMTEIKEKSPTSRPSKTKKSTTPPCKDWFKSTTYLQDNENFHVSGAMDDVSSDGLFVLDFVGSTNLKDKYEKEEEVKSESKIETKPSRRSDENGKSGKATRVKEVNKKNHKYWLSSTIDPHLDKLLTKNKSDANKVLNTTKLAADPTSEIVSERQKKKRNKERRDKVSSDKWFNMKAPELTKDVKNQLSVLQLREILDRKNFYKSNDRKRFPKYFQMGKVVESPADFYHARIPKKQRKATLLDEVMADADMRKYQKRKYAEIFGDAKKTKNKKKRKPVST